MAWIERKVVQKLKWKDRDKGICNEDWFKEIRVFGVLVSRRSLKVDNDVSGIEENNVGFKK